MSTDTPPPAQPNRSVANDSVDQVIRYHIRTKHHFNRYARSSGFLDWGNQPDPFRRFEGAALVPLPLLTPDEEPVSPDYESIFVHGAVPCRPVDLHSISRFLEFALAISAWKRAAETEWALRSNPSSGNLHPTEGYVVFPRIDGLALEPGCYHYAPKEHGLEFRAGFPPEGLSQLLASFPTGSFLVGLTSVHWREAWKYGERAFRYCNHDVGHAIGTLRIAAATLGWRMALLDGVSQNTVAMLLGTYRTEDFGDAEPEHPDCVTVVWPDKSVKREASCVRRNEAELPLFVDPTIVRDLTDARWYGQANRLSREHVRWEVIDEAAEASWKTQADKLTTSLASSGVPLSATDHASRITLHDGPSAGRIIRQRRSAVSFDGKTSIDAGTFFLMLRRVMPQADRLQWERPMPWDLWPYDPAIHLLLFVHRVERLVSGLYFLVRDVNKLPVVQQSLNPELTWTKTPGCPDDLPLYWLLEGDARRLAAQVSCHQDIAGDSAFSLSMLAEFDAPLRERGAWWYPRMFWESGLVGQVLYLEAEAAGIRATGIGCFFDDPVHEIVAVKGMSLQSLYHFTVGGPVEDRRLTTLPPYVHLRR